MMHTIDLYEGPLEGIGTSKMLITTLNAHSFNMSERDAAFREALQASDILLPDGIGVVWASRLLNGRRLRKIAGSDLFHYEMERLHREQGRCFFLGSSEQVLQLICERVKSDYPGVGVHCYAPPYLSVFDEESSRRMIDAVNRVEPDVLFVGMTAPKQEKWAYAHFHQLQAGHICCIGAVFDFYAGTVSRAPDWMINAGLEWLYRLLCEPHRMWRRYLVGNTLFVAHVLREWVLIVINRIQTKLWILKTEE